jgi:uncharacterized protein YdhG (YjbR/CyaY superfamily)
MKKFATVSAYIAAYPPKVQRLLRALRAAIKQAAPGAEEGISYGMPVFKLKGNLVYFGAFKDHISFFPTSSGTAAFKSELRRFKWSKGTIQFPIEKPLPLGLVKRITKFRLRENLAKKS